MKRIAILLFAAFACWACEKELTWHRDDIPEQLQVNAQLTVGDTLHIVHLAVSDAQTVRSVKDGSVRCLVNGVPVATGRRVDQDTFPGGYAEPFGSAWHPLSMRQESFVFQADFRAGDVVRIEAEAEGGRFKAWSEVTVPAAPRISLKDTARQEDNESRLRIRLTGRDDGRERNFYRIGEVRTFRQWIPPGAAVPVAEWQEDAYVDIGRDPLLNEGIETDDLDLFGSYVNQYRLFTDHLIDGKAFDLSFLAGYFLYGDTPQQDQANLVIQRTTIHVAVLAITETEYDFLRAMNLYDSLGGNNVFTEPASFPDNVEGGVGVVSIAHPTRIEIRMPDRLRDISYHAYE